MNNIDYKFIINKNQEKYAYKYILYTKLYSLIWFLVNKINLIFTKKFVIFIAKYKIKLYTIM